MKNSTGMSILPKSQFPQDHPHVWSRDQHERDHGNAHLGGLLEGFSGARFNADRIESLKQFAADVFKPRARVVIEPVVIVRTVGSRSWLALPAAMVVAEFNSRQPARDPDQDGSSLAIGWFQDTLQPLISPEIREKITQVNWTGLAMDWGF